MSSIKLDLFRRDFTVNTLAIQLDPDKFGTLIDFFGAQKDLKEKTIRVLHNLSFVEDPTRVFRAIRFEQKMDFFKRLSGRRVFSELRQILEEENPTSAIIRLHDYDLLHVIHPSITLTKELVALFNAVKKVLSWHDLLFLEESYMKWTVYFLALIRHCDKETIFIKERFEADRCLHWMERHLPLSNSTLYHQLTGFRIELALYMMAATKSEKVKKNGT